MKECCHDHSEEFRPKEPEVTEMDPVCGLEVDVKNNPFRLTWEGQVYRFCGTMCMTRFIGGPGAYLRK
jgi:YHS domain-containing protein